MLFIHITADNIFVSLKKFHIAQFIRFFFGFEVVVIDWRQADYRSEKN